MADYRKLTFGKYKGEYILYIIATHIGWIMWALENVKWFKLNDQEQTFYDWCAIAILKYKMEMVFPTQNLIPFIKDKEALENFETPMKYSPIYGGLQIEKGNSLTEALKAIGVYVEDENMHTNDFISSYNDLSRAAISDFLNLSDEEQREMEDMGITPPLPFY